MIAQRLPVVLASPPIIKTIISSIDENMVGASYQAFFQFGKPPHQAEHYIPIYVANNNDVHLYLIQEHKGTGALREFEVYVDNIKIDLDRKRFERANFIVLRPYLNRSNQLGVYDFNQSFHTIWFKSDATQQTNDVVSIKALINVVGISTMTGSPAQGELE